MKSIAELKKLFGQIMNTKVLVLIFIVGIGLMLLPGGDTKKKEETTSQDVFCATYREGIEKQLKTILSSVKGVGSVEVMVTLEHDGKTHFATDESLDEQKGEESSQGTNETTYVLKNDAGGGESPVVLQRETPKVSGVLVIASGAENADVRANITNAVRAVLGVKTHRVEVLVKK